MSILKVIRAKCIDCSGGSTAEVRDCAVTKCPLHPYRMGSNPFRAKRVLTEEQRNAARQRLSVVRKTRAGGSLANSHENGAGSDSGAPAKVPA